MKACYVFILLMLSSFSPGIADIKAASHLSEDVLVLHALKELGLKASETDFIVSRTLENAKETIIVLPEVANEAEDYYELNTHIVIADNTSGEITHTYFESAETNGWISDAIFIEKISIDTLSYKLDNAKNAFGVTVSFKSMSQPNPYNEESVSLFTKDKDGLIKVLNHYTVHETTGQVNVNSCYAEFNETNNHLSMGVTKTHGYYDIIATRTISQINYHEDKNGECKPVEKLISSEDKVLKFNGKVYKPN